MTEKELLKYKHTPITSQLNYLLIPVNNFPINEDGKREFNEVLEFVKSLNLKRALRTRSGGLVRGRKMILPAYDIDRSKYCIEIVLLYKGNAYRFQFRTQLKSKISGRKAFTRLKAMLLKDGIDLEKYAISNGLEVKKEIPSPLIKMKHKTYYDQVFSNVNHIDFHSSYPAGLVNTHEEFRKTIERLYEGRKENEDYKLILNLSIGFFQSINGCGAKYAHLAKDAITDSLERLKNISKKLEDSGKIVLLYNTDGVWYMGSPYHAEGEGEKLGQWSNDIVGCKLFRAKSDGCYEYIDANGVYHAVVRGIPDEDKKSWKWGDIYEDKAKVDIYIFDEKEGVKKYD